MTITEKYILFFGTDWPSNFAESPITVADDFQSNDLFGSGTPTVTFKTAEAYYQSRKAVMAGDKVNYYKIVLAPTPAETKRISHLIKLDPKAWNKVRVKYMWDTLIHKFVQNPTLKDKLLHISLEGKKFVEASPWDCFWGAGMSEKVLAREIEETGDISWFDFNHDLPRAENMLGELLGKVRDQFKNSL